MDGEALEKDLSVENHRLRKEVRDYNCRDCHEDEDEDSLPLGLGYDFLSTPTWKYHLLSAHCMRVNCNPNATPCQMTSELLDT